MVQSPVPEVCAGRKRESGTSGLGRNTNGRTTWAISWFLNHILFLWVRCTDKPEWSSEKALRVIKYLFHFFLEFAWDSPRAHSSINHSLTNAFKVHSLIENCKMRLFFSFGTGPGHFWYEAEIYGIISAMIPYVISLLEQMSTFSASWYVAIDPAKHLFSILVNKSH